MSLVFAGVCSHGPGLTARSERADPDQKQRLDAAYARMRESILASRPDALVVIAAEHFANFFMDRMPSFAVGMAEHYEGPIEDPEWLRIARRRIPGDRELSRRLIDEMMIECHHKETYEQGPHEYKECVDMFRRLQAAGIWMHEWF